MGIRGELFSSKVILPNRTYFFNVKENRMGDLYLNIVESKNRDNGGFDRQSVILFADDLQEFLKSFDDSLKVLEKAVREKRKTGKTTAKHDEGRERIRGGSRDETREERPARGGERSGVRKERGGLDRKRETLTERPGARGAFGGERGNPRGERPAARKTSGGERNSPRGGRRERDSSPKSFGMAKMARGGRSEGSFSGERGSARGGSRDGARSERTGSRGSVRGGTRGEHDGTRNQERKPERKRVVVRKRD